MLATTNPKGLYTNSETNPLFYVRIIYISRYRGAIVLTDEASTEGSKPLVDADPDWETFEKVEDYVADDDSLLRVILPTRVWDALFAPTSMNPGAVQEHRRTVAAQFASVFDRYRGVIKHLRGKSDLDVNVDDDPPVSEQISSIPIYRFPVSSAPRRDEDSFESSIAAIEEAIQHEQQLLDDCKVLLSRPRTPFLHEDERTALLNVQTTLAHSIENGRDWKATLEEARAETRQGLNGRLDTWEEELGSLEADAQPFFQLDQYLAEEELIREVETVRDEIQTFRKKKSVLKISGLLSKRFRLCEHRASRLLNGLSQSRAKYAAVCLDEIEQTLEAGLKTLDARLSPAKEQGEVIHDRDELFAKIETLRGKVEEVRQAPWREDADSERVASLSAYESRLTETEDFIEEKTQFDASMAAFEKRYKKLVSSVQPYLEYERYLTRPAKETLSTVIVDLRSDLETFADDADFTVLGDADRRRYEEVRDNVQTIQSHFRGYNPEFIRRQRRACEALFSSVGPDDLRLTPEQQEAVIRNDIYNQVIAAAGTGKTLTLTTRVAYLIKKQDIDPQRILVVTYTNEATEEMRTRLAEYFDITEVEVRTIHSFGREIVQTAENGYVETIDSHEKINLVDRHIRNARETAPNDFLKHYYEFLVHYDDVYYDEADFETKEAYVEARAETEYLTLREEGVRSRAEKVIADFLTTHQVTYRYEDRATWADEDPQKAGYNPDFYLPTYDVYIEHWGLDESGSVAPWFSQTSEEYHTKIRWARNQFQDADATLAETYEFEHESGQPKQVLRHRLTNIGVDLDQLEFKDLVNHVFDYSQREGWIHEQFRDFIDNAKQFDVRLQDIDAAITPRNPRQYHFAKCGQFLLQRDRSYLTENDLIDFTDMIYDAVDLIQEDPETYRSQYDHILVDEFQDVGKGTLELAQELTGPDAARLFAVGDDWQSIYSFQGAAIEYFTNFEEYFDVATRTDLTANFRCPPQIVKAGNDLINQNTQQLEKSVQATVDYDTQPRVHTLRGYAFYDYVRRVRRYTLTILNEYLQAEASPDNIMILCRYDDAVPFLDEIKKGLQSQEIPYVGKSDQYRGPDNTASDGVAVYSLYQSKGREAEHVILVHAATGSHGFPPDDMENELLALVQPLGIGGIEEERRGFYVAITRAKQSLDLLTRGGHESQFLEEISEYIDRVDTGQVEPLDEVGELMSVEVQVGELRDPWKKQHQRGILQDQYGGSARFVSWESTAPPTLEEGEWYELTGVKVGTYKNEKELILAEGCSVTYLETGPRHPETPDLP